MELTPVQLFAVWALPVLFAITVHEVAHGWVASLFGDKTAFILGRLTLNPAKHVDLLGTIIVPGALLLLGGPVFGWAKPVPINAFNLRHPKRDMALIAAAGPAANFIMAILWGGIAKVGILLLHRDFPGALAISYMGQAGMAINIFLIVLNLLPLPPLDGGHILMGILPKKLSAKISLIAPFGFFVVIALLAFGLLGAIVNPGARFLHGIVASIWML